MIFAEKNMVAIKINKVKEEEKNKREFCEYVYAEIVALKKKIENTPYLYKKMTIRRYITQSLANFINQLSKNEQSKISMDQQNVIINQFSTLYFDDNLVVDNNTNMLEVNNKISDTLNNQKKNYKEWVEKFAPLLQNNYSYDILVSNSYFQLKYGDLAEQYSLMNVAIENTKEITDKIIDEISEIDRREQKLAQSLNEVNLVLNNVFFQITTKVLPKDELINFINTFKEFETEFDKYKQELYNVIQSNKIDKEKQEQIKNISKKYDDILKNKANNTKASFRSVKETLTNIQPYSNIFKVFSLIVNILVISSLIGFSFVVQRMILFKIESGILPKNMTNFSIFSIILFFILIFVCASSIINSKKTKHIYASRKGKILSWIKGVSFMLAPFIFGALTAVGWYFFNKTYSISIKYTDFFIFMNDIIYYLTFLTIMMFMFYWNLLKTSKWGKKKYPYINFIFILTMLYILFQTCLNVWNLYNNLSNTPLTNN